MESSLLKGYVEKRKKNCCQPPKEGGYQQSVNQVTCIATSMGPINSGQSNESWCELSVTSDKPLVEDNVVEPSVVLNIGQNYQEVATRVNAKDPQSLVSLQSGINTVETSQEKLNGGYKEEENTGTECSLNFKEHVRAVETGHRENMAWN